MNNLDKQYTDLLNDAYMNYLKQYEKGNRVGIVNYSDPLQYIPYSNEEFINKIKTYEVFAKKWGFQVYTRELSLEERMKILINKGTGWNIIEFNNRGHEYMNEENLPTRAISLTYNNQTIEIYE